MHWHARAGVCDVVILWPPAAGHGRKCYQENKWRQQYVASIETRASKYRLLFIGARSSRAGNQHGATHLLYVSGENRRGLTLAKRGVAICCIERRYRSGGGVVLSARCGSGDARCCGVAGNAISAAAGNVSRLCIGALSARNSRHRRLIKWYC